jgi:hypothetical protein
MATVGAAQTFNDDLLANADDVRRAGEVYPLIAHVLDHPELRAIFERYDEIAKAAKRRMYRGGLATVACGTLSLGLVAVLVVFGAALHQVWPPFEPILAFLAAAFGIASAVLAAGILRSPDKETWLSARFMTERLRQFHFQSMVCRLAEIAASQQDDPARQRFRDQRATWLARFCDLYEDKQTAELGNILVGDEETDFWLHPRPTSSVPGADAALAPVFDAYRSLRILHQLQYASYKLGESHTLLPSLPRSQAALASKLSFLFIALLLGIDLLVAALVGFGSVSLAEIFGPVVAKTTQGGTPDIAAGRTGWIHEMLTWLHLAALILGIFVLAIRALEEGLKPDREVERYVKYRSAIRAVRDRFDEAETAAEKLDAMKQMERLSFDEMCDFLRTHSHARFVM